MRIAIEHVVKIYPLNGSASGIRRMPFPDDPLVRQVAIVDRVGARGGDDHDLFGDRLEVGAEMNESSAPGSFVSSARSRLAQHGLVGALLLAGGQRDADAALLQHAIGPSFMRAPP